MRTFIRIVFISILLQSCTLSQTKNIHQGIAISVEKDPYHAIIEQFKNNEFLEARFYNGGYNGDTLNEEFNEIVKDIKKLMKRGYEVNVSPYIYTLPDSIYSLESYRACSIPIKVEYCQEFEQYVVKKKILYTLYLTEQYNDLIFVRVKRVENSRNRFPSHYYKADNYMVFILKKRVNHWHFLQVENKSYLTWGGKVNCDIYYNW